MKIGITFGVFDLFHYGHLNFLINCKNHCDWLITCVHDDVNNTSNKEPPFYSIEQRINMIKHLSLVDETLIYNRVDLDIQKKDFQIFFYGEDQNHKYFKSALSYCNQNGYSTKMIGRTPDISTSMLRSKIL